MLRSAVTPALCATILLLAPARSRAQGFDEVPEPGELEPEPPPPERYFAAAGLVIALFHGGAARDADTSLGCRADLVRWLRPSIGLALSGEHVVVAKDRVLPSSLDVSLQFVGAGVRARVPQRAQALVFAEALAGIHTKALAGPAARRISRSAGMRIGAGAAKRVAPNIRASAQISYTFAQVDTVAVELAIGRAF